MDAPQLHRLFFAIFLDADSASSAVELARQLKLQHQLRGKLQPAQRLHVTLHWLRDHPALPLELVRSAKTAGSLAARLRTRLTRGRAARRMRSFREARS